MAAAVLRRSTSRRDAGRCAQCGERSDTLTGWRCPACYTAWRATRVLRLAVSYWLARAGEPCTHGADRPERCRLCRRCTRAAWLAQFEGNYREAAAALRREARTAPCGARMDVAGVELRCTAKRGHDGPHTDGAATWARVEPGAAWGSYRSFTDTINGA